LSNKIKYFYSIMFAILLTINFASAMPPLNGGPMPDRPSGVDEPDPFSPARDDADLEGEWNLLILLVDFPDYPWDHQEDENFDNEGNIYTPEQIESMLFSEGSYAQPGAESEFTGSMRDFYTENSHGNFTVTGTVTEWIRAPEAYTFYCNGDGEFGTPDDNGYGEYEQSVRQLVEDALEIADENVNFADYDNDDNGLVDGLFIVHAGPGAEVFGGNALGANYIWSHKWNIRQQERDGVIISGYTIQPEDGTIGVFCHEFGHALGLPDLYDTDYSSNGMGEWELMAGGGWTYRPGDPPGTSPIHMSAWCKIQLGWVDVINIDEPIENVEIEPVEESGVVYRLWTDGDAESSEYFLVENRQRIGFDRALVRRQIANGLAAPEGLLITHIDETRWRNGGNTDDEHRLVDVEEASPVWLEGEPFEHLDGDGKNLDLHLSNRGDDGDLWPGFSELNEDRTEWTGDRNHTVFNLFSTPSSNSYDGNPSLVNIYDIGLDGENVIASFSVSAPDFPLLYIQEWTIDDGENGNGAIEPGEVIELSVSLSNIGNEDATSVSASISYEGELAEITRGATDYPDVPSNENRDGNESFIIEIAEDAPTRTTLALSFVVTTAEMEDFEYTIRLGINPSSDWYKVEGNPVLSGNIGNWDTAILSPSIIVENDTIRCWYVGTAAEPGEDGVVIGAVGYTFSVDGGMNWIQNEAPVLTADQIAWVGEGISGIDVERLEDGRILMMLSAPDEEGVVKIGQAFSENGTDWEALDDPVVEPDGFVIQRISGVQLSIVPYAGNSYACGISADTPLGSVVLFAVTNNFADWTIDQNLAIPPSGIDERCDALTVIAPEVKLIQGENVSYELYYTGTSEDDIGRLARADFDGFALEYYPGLGTLESILEADEDDWAGVTDIIGCRIFDWQGEKRMLYTGTGEGSIPAVGLAIATSNQLTAPLMPDYRTTLPELIFLNPVYPNPFNNRVTLSYQLMITSTINLKIVDVNGRTVKDLYSGSQQAGNHHISWNGLDSDQTPVGSGTYFLLMESDGVTLGKKLLLIK